MLVIIFPPVQPSKMNICLGTQQVPAVGIELFNLFTGVIRKQTEGEKDCKQGLFFKNSAFV